MTELPIHAVLPNLLGALRLHASAVLIAPPGAGKTTAVAPALLGEAWCAGTIILLSPRRVAARAAAERMAEMLCESAGETVGYLTRLDSKRSARTRILVMTEAIFVATILADPELAGVSAVLFDEAHERHLDSDLGLALAIESQAVLREDLRIVVMSATIDGARFADLLSAATITSEGRAHPLDVRWLGARPEARIEEAMADAVVQAWRDEAGDILGFLPGVREIERTAERLAARLPDALVLPLHGQIDPAGQRAAIRRDPQGRRGIVLATNIAETSLTLDGVRVVVDSGLTRRAEYDVAAGHTRLATRPASRASTDQRAGRAARQGPGVAYRLWAEAAHPGRAAFDPPEIALTDLAPLALALAQWGTEDPAALAWLDPPPAAAYTAAQERLRALEALDAAGRITPHGRLLARLPMDPPLAHMLLWAAERGAESEAAELALLLQERGLGGRGEDLETRLARWRTDRSPRAKASRELAARWARSSRGLRQAQPERTLSVAPASARAEPVEARSPTPPPTAVLLATAYPGNLARRRSTTGEEWLSASGRGFRLDPASPLARAEWLAIGDAQGEAKGARIMAAAALDAGEVETWLGERIERRATVRWNDGEARAEARLERRIDAIVLGSTPDPAPDAAAVLALLRARADPAALLPAGLAARLRYAGIDPGNGWLDALLPGRRDLAIEPEAVARAVLDCLPWDERQRLDRLAPREFVSPAGTAHPIDYAASAGPTVELRVQTLFGLDAHPAIGDGGAEPLLLSLTSPAGRPIQTTADLPGFWRGTWRDVVKEMKGRYPRHRWPDEPWAEKPSLKTKNAFQRAEK